jgi:hypothetical protein
VKQKKRAILYMTPHKGHFVTGLVLGEKAVKTALDSNLPDAVSKEIKSARKYAEGRGIRIEIRTKKDLDVVEKIAAAKMAN